ncbi:MAG: hypothetical protein SF182_11700 [Deltaproteobacteria bacterium]|nr:hypothetical protein [Deltaproteobacteria bacterium]
MIGAPRFIEAMLDLPIPLLTGVVFAFWIAIAVVIHRVLVPRITGPDGKGFGRFEAEVASQLGIVLGLLLSFNAVSVWEQSSTAREATLTEASALRAAVDLLPEVPAEQQAPMRAALRQYLAYVIGDEWPQLAHGSPGLERPDSLRTLTRLARASSNQDLHDAIATAATAREQRIRIATNRMLGARWSIVIVLGALALFAIGLLHAEHRRARAVALGMMTFAIAACFVILFAQVRPFVGTLALRPTELTSLQQELR